MYVGHPYTRTVAVLVSVTAMVSLFGALPGNEHTIKVIAG